ncbi:MAG: monovalent cation/H+ antiporter subunit A [Trueperaceae bacterium]|nr:monovalent cation/H+ antiporter subunit A [Trueperaceae bacterium]
MTLETTPLPVLALLPFVVSGAVLLLPRHARNAAAAMAGATALTGLALAVYLYPKVTDGRVLQHTWRWLPELGLQLTWRLDGLSWLFTLLVTGIGALVVLYARYYMAPEDPVPRFFSYLLAFTGAMLGLVLSGNLVQLLVFWELTSILSFLLIGYWHHNQNARDGARMALTVTGLGGLFLLVGVLIIGHVVGSFELTTVLANRDVLAASPLLTPAILCVLVGAFAKSAQFPLHFWLPHAMAAPTPVSAYLHSATMVKAGIYLMTRLWPVMAGNDTWYYTVSLAGLVTFLLGGVTATFQEDLKGILAYSTISHLGLITLLLGLSTPAAAVAAIFHTLNHATFKASLFMAAGIIDHETGTRDVRRLSGLLRHMPLTGTLAMVAAAAMAGVPLLNGFISKEMFLTETLEFHTGSLLDRLLPLLATVGSAFSVLYSVRFIHQVFFGPDAKDLPRQPHEPVSWMRLPIELLVAICLIIGVVPALTVGPLLRSAATAVLGADTPAFHLNLWHGVTPAFLLSLVAMALGTGLYVALYRRLASREVDDRPWAARVRARRTFNDAMELLVAASAAVVRFLGTRRLQPQLFLLVGASVLAGAAPFLHRAFARAGSGYTLGDAATTPFSWPFLVLWAFGALAAVLAAYLAKFHRLAALILTSGAGLVVCVTFVWLSAPDLAVTQLLVEIVTTVLLLLGLRWLPRREAQPLADAATRARTAARRGRDLVLALLAGGGMTALALAAMTRERIGGIGEFFVENALPGGGGRNVVNVILVDFRGFDTMGEITVLAVVALSVFALLRRFRPAREVVGSTRQQRRQDAYDEALSGRTPGDTATDYLFVPRIVMHLLFPIVTLFAIHLFMRGHDEPGGGFAAGVTMATAFILQYMARGTRWVEERLRVLPLRWIGLGLILAAGTGAGAWLFGRPFLTSGHGHVDLPLLGRVPLATATLFDLGVFALVIGATVLMLIAIAHQSIRTPRAAHTAEELEGATSEAPSPAKVGEPTAEGGRA